MPPKAKDRRNLALPAPPPVQAQPLDDQGDGDQDEPQPEPAEDEPKPEEKGNVVLQRWKSELDEAKEALTAQNLSAEQTQALIAKITNIKAKYDAFNITLDPPAGQATKSSAPSGHKMNTSNLPPFPETAANPSNHIRELKAFFRTHRIPHEWWPSYLLDSIRITSKSLANTLEAWMDRFPEWEDLSEQFITFFSRPQLKARLADDLIGMRMRSNESVQTYSARFMLEANGLNLELTDNLLLCRVYRGGLLSAIREEFDRRLTFLETTSKKAFKPNFEDYMETAISVELDLGRSGHKASDKSSDPCKRPGHSGHKASECRLTKAELVQSSLRTKSQQSGSLASTAPDPSSTRQSAAPAKPAFDKTRLRCANEWCPNRHNHDTVHCKSRPPIQ